MDPTPENSSSCEQQQQQEPKVFCFASCRCQLYDEKKIKYSCYKKVAFADWKASLMHLEMLISGRFSAVGLKALKEKQRQINNPRSCPKGCLIYPSYISSNFLANSFGDKVYFKKRYLGQSCFPIRGRMDSTVLVLIALQSLPFSLISL